jgi:hypothetical protein
MNLSWRILKAFTGILLLWPVLCSVDSSPAPSSELARSLPLATALPSNAVPFETEGLHVVVPALLNGHKVRLVLDNGADVLFLTPETAARAGIDSQSKGEVRGTGPARRSAQMATAQSLAVGATTARDIATMIVPMPPEFTCDGGLGNSFLESFAFHVDYDRKLVSFGQPSDKNFFGTPSTRLPFDLPFPGATEMGRTVQIEAEVDGIKANFAIDIGGAFNLVLYPWFTAKHKLRDRYPNRLKVITGVGVGGLTRAELVRLHSFKLGKSHFTNLISEFGAKGSYFEPDAKAKVAGVMGGGLLQHFNYTFDFPNRQLGLEPNRDFAKVSPPPASVNSGFVCRPGADGYNIIEVLPHSPAAEVGAQTGDRILNVNGKAFATVPFPKFREIFQAEPGTSVRLTLQTKKQPPREVTLVLRNLL